MKITIKENDSEKAIIQNLARDLVLKSSKDRERKIKWILVWLFAGFAQIFILTNFIGFLVFPLLIIELGIFAQILFSPSKVNTIILWLRRFHRPENSKLSIDRVLESLALGISTIVTLKDSKIKGSTIELMNRPGAFYKGWAIGCLSLIFFILTTLIAIVLMEKYDLSTFYRVTLFIFIYVLFLLVIFLPHRYYLKGSSIKIRGNKGIKRVDSMVIKLKSPKGLRKSLMVLKVHDEDWQSIVERWLDAADAVILDVSEISENLIWEMKCCKNKKLPEQVILFYGHPKGEKTELPFNQKKEIINIWGLENSKRLSIFCYPFTKGSYSSSFIQFGNGMRAYQIAKQYKKEIYYLFAKAIYYSKHKQLNN